MSEPHLTLLGLALRAGKLAVGMDTARQALAAGRATALLAAADLGGAALREITVLSEKHGVPLIRLPDTKQQLGAVLRRGTPGVLALTDAGFTESLYGKLPRASQ